MWFFDVKRELFIPYGIEATVYDLCLGNLKKTRTERKKKKKTIKSQISHMEGYLSMTAFQNKLSSAQKT